MSKGGGELIVVPMARYAVARPPATLAALGLGSCVAVIIYDPAVPIAGLAHVMLPSPADSPAPNHDDKARFATTAVPLLVNALEKQGGVVSRMAARLVGGAAMFRGLVPAGTMPIGERNVEELKAGLRQAGITLVKESVGEQWGRSVWFDVGRGTALIRSVGRDDRVI